jgi:hypothetical protein
LPTVPRHVIERHQVEVEDDPILDSPRRNHAQEDVVDGADGVDHDAGHVLTSVATMNVLDIGSASYRMNGRGVGIAATASQIAAILSISPSRSRWLAAGLARPQLPGDWRSQPPRRWEG